LNRDLRVILYVVFFVFSYTILHEFGHWLVATALGYNASFQIIGFFGFGVSPSGGAWWTPNSPVDPTLMASGGLLGLVVAPLVYHFCRDNLFLYLTFVFLMYSVDEIAAFSLVLGTSALISLLVSLDVAGTLVFLLLRITVWRRQFGARRI
jgi:Zn-dependent protease